jgi:cytochrome P450
VPPSAFNSLELLRRAGAARAVFGHLGGRRAAGHRSWIGRLSAELLETMTLRGSPGDLMADWAAPLPSAAMCRVMGLRTGSDGRLPHADEQRLGHWSDVVFGFNSHTPREISDSWGQLREYLAAAVARERAEPGNGLLGSLVAARDRGGALTEDELLDVAAALLVVGHKTLVSFLGLAAVALLRHPAQARSLTPGSPEPNETTRRAIDELLRWVLIENRGVARIATERAEIGGVVIEAGELVIVALHAGDRDPRCFPDPDRLDLTRCGAEHLAFGHGPHYCPGSAFARVQIEAALGALVPRLPRLELAVPVTELPWREGLILRTPATVPVTW